MTVTPYPTGSPGKVLRLLPTAFSVLRAFNRGSIRLQLFGWMDGRVQCTFQKNPLSVLLRKKAKTGSCNSLSCWQQVNKPNVIIRGSGVFLLLHYTLTKPRPECTCSTATLSSMLRLSILSSPRPTILIYCAATNSSKQFP